MNHCPQRDSLERLLSHHLVATELDLVERHVESCADCQRTLDELTDLTTYDAETRPGPLITIIGRDTGLVADPLGDTARAAALANEPMVRVMPAVAGYELISELGRGGMGVVYEARHVRLNRPCALKMILAGAHASPEDVARFLTEAEAIARLQHPYIIQIRQIGDALGLPFLELEYVSGGSLDQKLDGTPWPTTPAARLAEQVALGIAEAHRQGIVHRDLKPSNILLAADGTPKVGDFGLAKMLGSESGLTRTESVMGSPSYMAPEQAQGGAKSAGEGADVYAVGAILYELLTGRPPFRGITAFETLELVRTAEPVAPSRLLPGLPRDLETICLKSLQKEPAKRYQTALALADDLRRVLDCRPILARRISGVERSWRWCRRNRFVAAMTAIAAGAVLALAIGATMAALTFRAQRDQIRHADRQTRENLFESLMAQARATRFSRQVGQRFDSLAALDRAASIGRELKLTPERFELLRDQAIACLALPDMRKSGRVIQRPPEVLLVAFDPGMRRYALRFRDGTIQVKNIGDDQEVARFQARGRTGVWVFGFSPDGRYLATNHFPGFALTVWDIDKRVDVLNDPGPVYFSAAKFSPDSQRIAVLYHNDGRLHVSSLTGDRPGQSWPVQRPLALSFRQDGKQVAVVQRGTNNAFCAVLDADTGREILSFPVTLIGGAALSWSANGSTLALVDDSLKIYLYDAVAGTSKATLEGLTSAGVRIDFHPAGTLVAGTGWEGRLRLWDTVTGRPVFSLTGDKSTACEFSRDGRIAVALEDKVTVYEVDPALEYRKFAHSSDAPLKLERPSVRCDGRVLAVGTSQGVVVWDLASGRELAFLPIGAATQLMFEPSGNLLTRGTSGFWRWPVRLDCNRGEFHIGPPTRLPLSNANNEIDEDRSGQILALADHGSAHVITPERTFRVGPLHDCRYVAVSPDGQWVATGTHAGPGVESEARVWRVSDQEQVANLPLTGSVSVFFSPDGKWLMTANSPCRLWAVGRWALERRIGGVGHCFSPDGRLIMVQDAERVLLLIELESGRTVARLESPDSCGIIRATFSSDGARVVATTGDGPAVHVWDLRAIRRRLASMGLDWEAPAYADHDPAGASLPPFPPLQVDLGPITGHIEHFTEPAEALRARYTARIQAGPNDADAYHHRGHALSELRRFSEAIDDFTAAVRLRPGDVHLLESVASSCNNRAWELATGPEASRAPDRALNLARRAVDLTPKEALYLNTLGVAEYRAFRYAAATTTLERSLAAGGGASDAFDLLFLAMAHHRLGHRGQARTCFARAVRWLGEQTSLSDQYAKELAAFRAEAETVLKGPVGELPADVFAPSS
jgi:eukaryotic-like serine/threonine-protein kinase